MDILFSPHDDDNTLFAAFTCMRHHPLVVICTDSYIQPMRGDVGCSAEERQAETEAACKVLGCPVLRLRMPDFILNEADLQFEFERFAGFERVYLPALQGGNAYHDLVSQVGSKVFNNVTYYSTYAKGEHFTPLPGSEVIVPTEGEQKRKADALACYVSQINLASTRPHFEAVKGHPEYLKLSAL